MYDQTQFSYLCPILYHIDTPEPLHYHSCLWPIWRRWQQGERKATITLKGTCSNRGQTTPSRISEYRFSNSPKIGEVSVLSLKKLDVVQLFWLTRKLVIKTRVYIDTGAILLFYCQWHASLCPLSWVWHWPFDLFVVPSHVFWGTAWLFCWIICYVYCSS